MKKKWVILFSAVFVLTISVNAFGKVEHGQTKWGSQTLQKDGTYKLFASYIKEDGNLARNEWIERVPDGGVGVSVFEYYGDDGNILSDTTTPDGYLVNYEGRWYKNCTSATINETEESRIEKYGLHKPIPGGASWRIEFNSKNQEDEAQLINWLNNHMTVAN